LGDVQKFSVDDSLNILLLDHLSLGPWQGKHIWHGLKNFLLYMLRP
jgi:hypothetical protein